MRGAYSRAKKGKKQITGKAVGDTEKKKRP